MNRLHMLGTVSAVVAVQSAGTLAFSACGSTAPGSGSGLRLGAPPAAAVTPVAVAGFLAQFTARIDMPVISDDVRQWLDGAIDSAQANLGTVRRKMETNGFTNYPISKVFGNGEMTVYGVGNVDGVNFCAPFVANGQAVALAEGPALTALHFAMQDWPKNSPVSLTNGLLPVAKFHDFGSQFEVSLDRPLHYGTRAGDLFIAYDSDPAAGVGAVRVLSRLLNGETLLDKRYTFAWR
jgi:hypothetical protein